ncbi:MAG: helix-turn-helix domain-containing protein [Lachnospiraceae bacterium]|nr:helix-turn-helix domain-containing protein [Lachnospiraceae bacterium]
MQIGQVIRTYRKKKNMTQEEMAARLGVSAPAVNKWENGNSMPDIMLLAPIARLLDISLDTLLAFQEELTDREVNELVQTVNEKMKSEDFAAVFRWAKKKMEQYPNSEHLHLWMCMTLNAGRIVKEVKEEEVYDDFLCASFERLLHSREEYVRTTAADSLYGFFMRKEQYEKAEEYLAYFSSQNPERKRKQAFLYARMGRNEEACKLYEELLFSGYQILSMVLSSMFTMALQDRDMEGAEYLTDKMVQLIRLFEAGKYQEYAVRLELAQAEANVEETLVCAEGMLASVGQIGDYGSARLYGHMSFREPSDEFKGGMQEKVIELFRDEESFGYMKGNRRWEELIGLHEKQKAEQMF